MILTKKDNISEQFEFDGRRHVLIVGGVGTITLERSVNGSDFYPYSTDTSGGFAVFELNGECAYNGSLDHKGGGVAFRFNAELEEGEVEITMSRPER